MKILLSSIATLFILMSSSWAISQQDRNLRFHHNLHSGNVTPGLQGNKTGWNQRHFRHHNVKSIGARQHILRQNNL
jgi:hypothetical protein